MQYLASKNMAKQVLIFIFIYLSCTNAFAQKNTTHQSLYWLRFYDQLTLNRKFFLQNEIEDRRFFNHNVQHHLIIHSRLHYNILPQANIALGFTFSRQSAQIPGAGSTVAVPELRPVQEINYSSKLNAHFTIQQRLRIDERFIRKNYLNELQPGYDFNFRFRYRVQLNFLFPANTKASGNTLKLASEIMFNAGKNIVFNTFDQNRVYLGIEHDFNKNWAAELGYLKWYQQRPLQHYFFNRDIIRLTIYHRAIL